MSSCIASIKFGYTVSQLCLDITPLFPATFKHLFYTQNKHFSYDGFCYKKLLALQWEKKILLWLWCIIFIMNSLGDKFRVGRKSFKSVKIYFLFFFSFSKDEKTRLNNNKTINGWISRKINLCQIERRHTQKKV